MQPLRTVERQSRSKDSVYNDVGASKCVCLQRCRRLRALVCCSLLQSVAVCCRLRGSAGASLLQGLSLGVHLPSHLVMRRAIHAAAVCCHGAAQISSPQP